MKKLYLIVMLLFFVTASILAQNPNNHWQLGNSSVDFTTNPPTATVTGNSSKYGNASISDDNGDLLFYTDGKTVWNKNHNVMTNGSNIGKYVGINTIIVPNLGTPNQFYIFRSEQYLTLCLCPNSTFYLYSIIEFNSSNPLGIVLSINSTPLSQETEYSKALFSSSGIVENLHAFGALTSTKNNDNTAFWVVIQDQNKLLSYKIDSSGLNAIPVQSTFTNTQIYNPGSYNDNNGAINGLEGAKFRIAPNNLFLIGLEYTNPDNQPSPDSNFLNFQNFFYKINFNSTTGLFTGYESFSGGIMIYNFEISAQSTNLFYVRNKFPYPGPSFITNVVDGEICVKDLINTTNPIRILNEFGTATPSSKFSYLQRDRYDNLLISSTHASLNRNLYLHKIDNQDSYLGSSVVLNSISLNGNPISVLPELIPPVIPSCIDNLIITSNVTYGMDKKQASNTIVASNALNNGTSVIYHAGTSVTLSSGFNAKSGSTFRAYIAGCNTTFVQKKKSSKVEISTPIVNKDSQSSGLKLYPNPNTGIFTIDFGFDNKNEIIISIYDAHGKEVYQSSTKEATFDISLPNLSSGLYFVKLEGNNYKETVKFIKN